MTADQVATIHVAALRRHVEALAGPLLPAASLQRLQRELATDRRAFVNEAELLAFLLAAFKLLHLAQRCVDQAAAVGRRLDTLASAERAAYGRMRRLSTRAVQLKLAFAGERPMQPRRRGRRDETALRDVVVGCLCDLYPARGRSAQRRPVAVLLAGLVWPSVPDAENTRRDMRRRLKRGPVDSPELGSFLSALVSLDLTN